MKSKLPKKDRPYQVLAYDNGWPVRFAEEKKVLTKIFQDKALAIEHIGSTSVPGMWAKPQIDILILVENLKIIDELTDQLTKAGFEYQPDFDQYNERYYIRDDKSGERLTSIHILKNNDFRVQSYLNFKDYLNNHAEARKKYSQIKKQAYQNGANRAEYPKIKKTVLDNLLRQAAEWKKDNI